MTGIPIDSLPYSPQTNIVPLYTEEPVGGPFVEFGTARLRRSSSLVEVEGPHPAGGWLHCYMTGHDEEACAGYVSLAEAMSLVWELARKDRKTDATALADRLAPRAAALARFGTTHVDGVPVLSMPLPYTEESSHTLLVAVLPGPLGSTIDDAWMERVDTLAFVGFEVYGECAALEQGFGGLNAATRRKMLVAPSADGGDALSTGLRIGKDTVGLTQSVLGVLKNIGLN
ncbi:hypothetical protein [Streptomyces xanthophaeus]